MSLNISCKKKQHIPISLQLLLIFLLSQISLSNTSSLFSTNNKKDNYKIWNVDSLYDYTNQNYLSDKNKPLNLQNMIVDPENFLKSYSLNEAKLLLWQLYQKYEVSTYIFIISSIDNSLRDFSYKMHHKIITDNSLKNSQRIISFFIFVKDKKLDYKMTTPVRQKIPDNEISEILNRRKNALNNQEYGKLITGFCKDILYEYKGNHFIKKKNLGNNAVSTGALFMILVFVTFFIFIFSMLNQLFLRRSQVVRRNRNLFYPDFRNFVSSNIHVDEIENENNDDRTNREKKVEEFLKKNQSQKVGKIMEETCIICLEKFENDEDKKNNDNIINDNNNNQNEKNEKTVLPCGHAFHTKCISEWFLKETNCPLCRTKYNIFDEEKEKSKRNSLNIVNYTLNNNSEFINARNLMNLLDEFVRIQMMAHPDVNERFRRRVINQFRAQAPNIIPQSNNRGVMRVIIASGANNHNIFSLI